MTIPALLSTRIFDGAPIVSHGNEDAGFPYENLQHPQPRVRWKYTGTSNLHFVADLRDPDTGIAPGYDAFGLLFHNALPLAERWRIQSGNTTTGTGNYDSGEITLWPVTTIPSPDSYQHTLAYRSTGVHAFHTLPGFGVGGVNPLEEFYLTFDGSSTAFLDFGHLTDLPGLVFEFFLACRFRNTGAAANQMLMTTGAATVGTIIGGASNFQGFHLGLRSNGQVFAAVGDGTATGRFSVSGGSYTDNDWHTAMCRVKIINPRRLQLYVDGAQVADVDVDALDPATIDNGSNPIVVGSNGTINHTDKFTGDAERAVVTSDITHTVGDDVALSLTQGWLDSETPWVIPSAFPPGDGIFETILATIGEWVFSGQLVYKWTFPSPPGADSIALPSGVSRNTASLKTLSDPYIRVDIIRPSGSTGAFQAGRFVVSKALRPKVLYGSGTPTPQGSPPKLRNSWDLALSPEGWAAIGYPMTFERGNSPETLRSWGHDIHLIDGGKTIVAVNDITAAEPWTKQQGTVYGFIRSLDGPTIDSFDLLRARMEFEGM